MGAHSPEVIAFDTLVPAYTEAISAGAAVPLTVKQDALRFMIAKGIPMWLCAQTLAIAQEAAVDSIAIDDWNVIAEMERGADD